MDSSLRERLIRYEVALGTRDADAIDGGLMSLIAEDFVEFGSSGRVWTRDSIREVLEAPPAPRVSIHNVADRFQVDEIADGVALVCYRGPLVNRSSIWVRREGQWLLRFHQGTPIPPT